MAAPHSFPDGDDAATVEAKRRLRRLARAARDTGDRASPLAITTVLLAAFADGRIVVPPGAVIAGTWPLGSELDLRPLLTALHARGFGIALPETPPPGQALSFRRWSPDTPMLAEKFGTMRPDAPPARPDLLLVPLLAFDDAFHRLGYGGGYYDRTLAALRRPAIGCGLASQRVAVLPTGPHDRPLDAIATERGLALRDGRPVVVVRSPPG